MEIKATIGILAGSFDIIHPGYVKLFKEFNDACEYQFILLQDDPTIERPT
jgi:glycerol-3-phosphate cytidylyltransferase-like family protein